MGKSMALKATAMAKEQGPLTWTEGNDWESNPKSELQTSDLQKQFVFVSQFVS